MAMNLKPSPEGRVILDAIEERLTTPEGKRDYERKTRPQHQAKQRMQATRGLGENRYKHCD